MSIGGIQGNGQNLHGLGKAQGSGGADAKISKLEQELKQLEEGVKLAAMTGNSQLLAMLQQQLQGLQQTADSQQDMGGQSGGGRAPSLDARQKLDDFQQKADLLSQRIQMQLQSVQAQSGSQGAQGGGSQQDRNQAQGRDMRAMYPV